MWVPQKSPGIRQSDHPVTTVLCPPAFNYRLEITWRFGIVSAFVFEQQLNIELCPHINRLAEVHNTETVGVARWQKSSTLLESILTQSCRWHKWGLLYLRRWSWVWRWEVFSHQRRCFQVHLQHCSETTYTSPNPSDSLLKKKMHVKLIHDIEVSEYPLINTISYYFFK